MEITFVESGGFAGLVKKAEVDSRELPPDGPAGSRRSCERLPMPSRRRAAAPHPDAYTYEIRVVDDDGRERRIVADEQTSDRSVQELVKLLRARAKPARITD